MQSCFNLFYLPPQWKDDFAFEKQLDTSVFGGEPGVLTHVGLRVVPMGWTTSVGIIQNCIGRFVFQACGVSPDLEVQGGKLVPFGDAVVVCMDGYDLIQRGSLDKTLRANGVRVLGR